MSSDFNLGECIRDTCFGESAEDKDDEFGEADAENIMEQFNPVLVSKAKSDGTTVQKIVGNVVLPPNSTPLLTPITQKPCAFYWVRIDEESIEYIDTDDCGQVTETSWDQVYYEERSRDFILHDPLGNTSIFVPASDTNDMTMNVPLPQQQQNGDKVIRIANDDGEVASVYSANALKHRKAKGPSARFKKFMDTRGIPYTKSTFLSTKNCNLRINEGCFDEGETIAALGFVKARSVPVPGDGNATLELGRLTKESIGPRYFREESDDEKIWQQFFEPEIGQGGQSVDKVKTVALFTDVPETIGLSLERMEQMLPKFGVTPPVHAMGRQGSTVVAPIETVQPEVIDTIRLKIQQQIGTEDRLQKIYHKLDTDHDGMLSKKEFKKLIAAVVKAPTKVIFNAIWLDACHLRKIGDGIHELDVDTLKLWIFQKG